MIEKGIHRIRLFLSITILWLYNINIFGQESAQISIPFEIYDNAGGQKTLYFGLDQTATDGIDINLGESELPPYPPLGAFDARWLLPENNFSGSLSSWSDYRFASGFPFSATIEHRFRYQSAAGATAMFISWNLPQTITGLIQDLSNGIFINVQISGIGTYQVSDFQTFDKLKLFVYYNDVISTAESKSETYPNFYLEQNYPNPFNPITTIKFSLPEASEVTLIIYNELGEKVAELLNTNLEAGWYNYQWVAGDIASGMYIYELRTDKFISVKKMILTK